MRFHFLTQQQTGKARDADQMFVQCWAIVGESGSILKQHVFAAQCVVFYNIIGVLTFLAHW